MPQPPASFGHVPLQFVLMSIALALVRLRAVIIKMRSQLGINEQRRCEHGEYSMQVQKPVSVFSLCQVRDTQPPSCVVGYVKEEGFVPVLSAFGASRSGFGEFDES